ncbi:MAG: hypothetical protein ACK5W9_05595 [Bdellovibrionales bacterium]
MKAHYLVSIFLSLFLTLQAKAQSVSKISGTRVLLELGEMTASTGDRLITVDANGKRKGLVQIRQIKGTKATADILKGKPEVGHTLTTPKKAPSKSMSEQADYSRFRKKGGWGLTGSLMMNTMKISNLTRNSTDYSFEMTGTNFGVGGFYDYSLNSSWWVRAHGTVEMFDVKTTKSPCGVAPLTECAVQFTQIGGYGTFNYQIKPEPFRMYLGLGGGIFLYASKKSEVLDTNKFFFNSLLMGTFGFDYFMAKNSFIPVALEYQFIPDKEAGVSSIVLRAGWGKTF